MFEYPPPPAHAPRLGEGRYILCARLGEGGMATVYRAWDDRIGVWRAVKVMLPLFAQRTRLRTRFEREAHTLARLEHPNLVRVFDVGAQAQVPYLVMELVTGGTLVDWIEQHQRRMPPRMAVEAVLQLCQGAMHAHDAGVVHRDIKPQNVLITSTGICKLADFGIAQINDGSLTKTGSTMGTMGYMAPEQRKDAKSVDARSDLYSIAATLWYLLRAEAVADLFLAGEDKELLEGIPEQLQAIIRKAVAYQRDRRQPTLRAFADELTHALELLPPDPPCPTLPVIDHTPQAPQRAHFPELAPLFASASEEGALRPPAGTNRVNPVQAAMPYYMPDNSQEGQPPAMHRSPRPDDSLPEYIDRDALAPRSEPLVLGVEEPPVEAIEPEPPAPDYVRYAPHVAAVGVSGLLLFILVVLSWSAYGLQSASDQLARQRAELYGSIEADREVIYDLTALGASQKKLDGHYFAYFDQPGEPARAAAAMSLVTELHAAGDRLVDPSNTSASQTVTRERLKRLRAASEGYLRVRRDWEARATSLTGRAFRGVGIGEP